METANLFYVIYVFILHPTPFKNVNIIYYI